MKVMIEDRGCTGNIGKYGDGKECGGGGHMQNAEHDMARGVGGRGSGPRPLGKAETIDAVTDLRKQLARNYRKYMWREGKVLIISSVLVYIILFSFMVMIAPEKTSQEDGYRLIVCIVFLLISVYVSTFDIIYVVMFRITPYFRTDVNLLYPAALDRRGLVNHNIMTFMTLQVLLFLMFVPALWLLAPWIRSSFREVLTILVNLLILKLACYLAVNYLETLRRQGALTDHFETVANPVRLVSLLIFILYNHYPIFIVLVPRHLELAGNLVSPVVLAVHLLLLAGSAVLWVRHILPHAGGHWEEDRTSVPAMLSLPASERSGLFGEEVRELGRERDPYRLFKLLDERRFVMKEKGTGFTAVREKCNVVFRREHFNLFLTAAVPSILLFALVYPAYFEPRDREFLMFTHGTLLIFFLVSILISNDPINQETVAIENLFLLPIPEWRVILHSMVRTFKAGLAGIILGTPLMIALEGDPIYWSTIFNTHMLSIIIMLGAGSIILTTARMHMIQNSYPRMVQRGMSRTFGTMLLYLPVFLLYMGLAMITIGELYLSYLPPFIMATVLIVVLGPMASLHFYRTASIH